MKKKKQFQILSPDGFAIGMDTHFDTPEEAWENFEKWKRGYERQGYYSTVRNNRRVHISLKELKDYCKIQEI